MSKHKHPAPSRGRFQLDGAAGRPSRLASRPPGWEAQGCRLWAPTRAACASGPSRPAFAWRRAQRKKRTHPPPGLSARDLGQGRQGILGGRLQVGRGCHGESERGVAWRACVHTPRLADEKIEQRSAAGRCCCCCRLQPPPLFRPALRRHRLDLKNLDNLGYTHTTAALPRFSRTKRARALPLPLLSPPALSLSPKAFEAKDRKKKTLPPRPARTKKMKRAGGALPPARPRRLGTRGRARRVRQPQRCARAPGGGRNKKKGCARCVGEVPPPHPTPPLFSSRFPRPPSLSRAS